MTRLPGRVRAFLWPLLVFTLSVVPVAGVFTLTRLFFVRDLSLFFWSRHLWLRHTLFSGVLPLWDPHVAAGQPAVPDALNQILMPLTLAVRLLPSDVVSFNLWVALPLPIAALGTFAFLRTGRSAMSAAFGACAFALCGPAVSMLNAPNLSWSVALLPWVLWAAHRVVTPGPRGTARHVSLLAVVVALQALSGEPVTGASTAVVATGSVLVMEGWRRAAWTAGGIAAGAALAAAQLLPTFAAGVAAHRGVLATPDFWSLHPLSLWETLAPHLFGDYYTASLADLPWMVALNFGRDPFFYSLYIGPVVVLLAAAALIGARRRTLFWAAVALAFLLAALGGYTPVYPLIRRVVPGLLVLRFPVKYFLVTVFAVAVLAADGLSLLEELPPEGGSYKGGSYKCERHTPRDSWLPALAGSIAIFGVLALLISLVSARLPGLATRASHALAISTHLRDPSAGAAFLARTAPALAARAGALLLAAGVLLRIAASNPRYGRLAAWVLFGATCADLAITNGNLNPTADASAFAPPPWYRALAGQEDRLYVGGRVRGFMNVADPDASETWRIPAAPTAVLGRMELHAELPMAPSGWDVREALSYDLPQLWPAEYEHVVRRFEDATRAERDAFLRRSAVRWCVLPAAQDRPWKPIAEVPHWSMRLYECNPGATRALVSMDPRIARDPSDEAWQRDGLFDPTAATGTVRLASAPARRAASRPPQAAFATIVRDAPGLVTVDAALPQDGVLVLRDAYDPAWMADVDGVAAPIVRADALYRAVALPAGRHVVRFTYRPRALRNGLIVSVITAAVLVLLSAAPERRRRAAGFTLIELMIVMAIIAILLAVAFNQYRRLQAKGNEASAMSSLRSIATAQYEFALLCGNHKYVTTLAALAQPMPSTGQAFLSPDLTRADAIEKSGYTIRLAAKPRDDGALGCNGAVLADSYAATADPLKPGMTGASYYGINADRVLFEDSAQTFTGNMPETGAPSHGTEVK